MRCDHRNTRVTPKTRNTLTLASVLVVRFVLFHSPFDVYIRIINEREISWVYLEFDFCCCSDWNEHWQLVAFASFFDGKVDARNQTANCHTSMKSIRFSRVLQQECVCVRVLVYFTVWFSSTTTIKFRFQRKERLWSLYDTRKQSNNGRECDAVFVCKVKKKKYCKSIYNVERREWRERERSRDTNWLWTSWQATWNHVKNRIERISWELENLNRHSA